MTMVGKRTKFEKYVEDVENIITDYTKKLTSDEIHEIEDSIEESDAGSGKIWLEDFIDARVKK